MTYVRERTVDNVLTFVWGTRILSGFLFWPHISKPFSGGRIIVWGNWYLDVSYKHHEEIFRQ